MEFMGGPTPFLMTAARAGYGTFGAQRFDGRPIAVGVEAGGDSLVWWPHLPHGAALIAGPMVRRGVAAIQVGGTTLVCAISWLLVSDHYGAAVGPGALAAGLGVLGLVAAGCRLNLRRALNG